LLEVDHAFKAFHPLLSFKFNHFVRTPTTIFPLHSVPVEWANFIAFSRGFAFFAVSRSTFGSLTIHANWLRYACLLFPRPSHLLCPSAALHRTVAFGEKIIRWLSVAEFANYPGHIPFVPAIQTLAPKNSP